MNKWSPLAAARTLNRYSGPVTIVACGLVTIIALFVMPLLSVPEDGSVTGPELASADGPWKVLLGLSSPAVAAIIAVGARLLVSCGRAAEPHRGGAIAVLVMAGLLVIAAAGLTVVHSLAGSGTLTSATSPGVLGAGWWLALLGLVGAGAGAVVVLTMAGAPAGSFSTAKIGVSLAVSISLAALVGTAAVIVVRDGTTWSGGLWGGSRAPSASATCVQPPGFDSHGKWFEYDAPNAVDARVDSAWRCPGNGIDQELRIDLGRWMSINTVSLLPGYAKIDPWDSTDRYAQNRRISAVRYTFDGGRSVEQQFDTSVSNRSMQSMAVPVVQTKRVTITILSSVDGVVSNGMNPLDRVAISEVIFE